MTSPTRSLIVALFTTVYSAAHATSLGVTVLPALPSMPETEATRCIAAAAGYHTVNPWILRAILSVESNFNPRAVNVNANKTIDVGMAQINSIHFAELQRHGIAPTNLLDGCIASYVAAWHLAKQIRRNGNTWYAIARYHSASPCQNTRYAGLLWNRLLEWGVVIGKRLQVKSLAQCGYKAPPATQLTVTRRDSAVAFDGE
jgi:hypothetical protein